MAKLVLFLQTDVLLREKHTSTSLVEAFFLVHFTEFITSLPLHKFSIQWNLFGFTTIAINEITPG